MRLSHTTFRFSCPALNRAKRADLSVKFVTGAIIALSVLVAWQFPEPLRLIMLGSLLVAVGFGSAIVALLRREPRDAPHISLWDQAGILVFLGFAAALLSDSAEWIAYLDGMKSERLANPRQ